MSCLKGLSSHALKQSSRTVQGKNQAEKTQGPEQEVINGTWGKTSTKTSSAGKVKAGRETNTTINRIFVRYNVHVT